ncbi:HutD family protein [Chitinivorax sp. B]|uniref:HutD/Ves family protein n=1 Tax=Chitinivorax sp. B TaxID=2502235 RepID=UPI0010F709AA|nr:HutD family protein [Chitinivorax sp. B]
MRHLPSCDYPTRPWKNGGGQTREIIVFPEGAGFDDLDWRASMAQIDQPGPFSAFNGLDRSLTLIAGDSLSLYDEDRCYTLTPYAPSIDFPGETAFDAHIPDGPVLDFNVMSRRGRFMHTLRRCKLQGQHQLRWQGDVLLLFLASTKPVTCHGSHTVTLQQHDAVLMTRQDVEVIEVTGNTFDLILIEISDLR